MEQEKVLRESFKLWEQFASTYNKMMFEAMEKTIQQSEALKQQMDQAVERSMKAWKIPAAANPAEIVAALHKLSAQVEALSEKVDGLEKSLKKSAAKKE
jgi:glutamine synthetase type III